MLVFWEIWRALFFVTAVLKLYLLSYSRPHVLLQYLLGTFRYGINTTTSQQFPAQGIISLKSKDRIRSFGGPYFPAFGLNTER